MGLLKKILGEKVNAYLEKTQPVIKPSTHVQE
jgi:hypothetical protein